MKMILSSIECNSLESNILFSRTIERFHCKSLTIFFILENWTFHFLEGIEKFMIKTTLNIFFYQVQSFYDN